ncbi:MAG TPA: dethiobiotin synthase [Burkholderiales bacterium]|jgi:dethiobiotin synthetase|nr:dethiobiotin synthase [Burkholderiales bacterium]
MTHGYFVTGTDTGVGKTLIACALLRAFVAAGYRAVGMKPVAAGAEPHGEHVVYGDVEALCAAGNVVAPREVVNPYAFRRPIAPHIAAAEEGVVIDLAHIERSFRTLAERSDAIVVEGVGGFRVPLGPAADTGDLACRLGLPVILVVGMRLGCLNHALLTAESIAAHGLALAGWVANHVDPDMGAADENVAALEARLPARLLARVPHAGTPGSDAVGRLLAHIVPRRHAGRNLL